ncbi:hypothetical protein M7I_7972 [Glarea lozoyensis 74030]|uniref:Domain of unknown function at the cortex 1 domain-containing protein n=1 Tax=Glarea lozoyensis (strain ATCC 74030 / MF5533) TaxID=1104152 RepID=H0EYR4_GLAL7|nr:hypothetical protein M7I_7972 [Glarea lozoyensis 74030]
MVLLHLQEKVKDDDEEDDDDGEEVEDVGLIFEEGGDADGIAARKEIGVPDAIAARKKFFLNEENRKTWSFKEGVAYGCDFYNPYLDFNDFALRLPGFTMPIMKYWDGQGLRGGAYDIVCCANLSLVEHSNTPIRTTTDKHVGALGAKPDIKHFFISSDVNGAVCSGVFELERRANGPQMVARSGK